MLITLCGLTMAALAAEPPSSSRDSTQAVAPLTLAGGPQPSAEVSLLHASSSLNLKTGDVQRTFIVQADLIIPEAVDAVGLSHQIELTELKAADGQDLLAAWRRTGQLVFGGPRHYGAVGPHRQAGRRGAVSLSTSLNGLPYIPPQFQTVRGKAYVLLATRRVTRELSPLTQGALIELTPSLSIQVVRIKREGASLEVQFAYDAQQPSPFFNPTAVPPFIDTARLIDDQGQEVTGHGGATPPPPAPGAPGDDQQEPQPQGGLFQGQGELTFALPEPRQPAALLFDVVVEMQEREVEFLARDVPMPIEPDEPAAAGE